MKGYRKYFGKKLLWFALSFVVAVVLNFVLPRLMPADPVAVIMSKMGTMTDATAIKQMYDRYAAEFGVNKPMWEQFLIFCGKAVKGDFGTSFSQYPRSVSDIISSSIGWTIALQFPAIITGWILGNLLGALAAYLKKGWDKVLLPTFLFLGNVPAFGMAVMLLLLFAVTLKWFPIAGGYAFDMIPNLNASPDSKTAEYPSINSVEYKMTLPQAFSEKPAEMLFGYFSYILFFIILAFAGNLMILTWENHENVSSKIFKILSGVIFAVIVNCIIVLLDYLSTMLTLNFYTTVGPLCILGMYIGYAVYGKIQDNKDRKLRAKGL